MQLITNARETAWQRQKHRSPKPDRKRKLSIYDIGRLPSVPVVLPQGDAAPAGTLKQYRERLAEEEKQAAAKDEQEKRNAIETARIAELTSPASQKIAKYWRTDLKEIATNGLDMTPNDLAGDYEIGPRDNVTEVATWKEFKENLASFGCSLSDSGGERLGAYLCSLAYHRGVSLTAVSNWTVALERLHSLDVFRQGELQGYRPRLQSTVEQPRRHAVINPLAEIETLNLDSREGNRRAKEIATNDFFGREMAHVVDQWESWLFATFNYILTDDARKAAGQWWERNPTANPLRGESWTALRLNLVKQGVIPASCKTSEEILNETIEKSSERSDSYETRRSLRQAIRDLAQ